MGSDAPLAQNFAHLLATDRMSVQHMPRFACHANPVDSISQPTVSHGLDPSHPPDIIRSTLPIATPTHPPTRPMHSQADPAHTEHEHDHLAHAQRPLTSAEAIAWSKLTATSLADGTIHTAGCSGDAYIPQGHLAWRSTRFVPDVVQATDSSVPPSIKPELDSSLAAGAQARSPTSSTLVPGPADVDTRHPRHTADLKAEVCRLESALAAARMALQQAERLQVGIQIVPDSTSTHACKSTFVSTAHRPQLSPAQRQAIWCTYCHAHGHTLKMGCEERHPCCHCGAADHRGEACPTRPKWPLSGRSRRRLRQTPQQQITAPSACHPIRTGGASDGRARTPENGGDVRAGTPDSSDLSDQNSGSDSSLREMYSQQVQLWADPTKRRHRLPPAAPVPTYRDFKRDAAVTATAVAP
jgi:hypothetical protein